LHEEGGISMSKEPTAAEKMIGDFAPKLVELTDRVLFGDIWERKELSKRDRSLVTVAALIALNRPEQLRFHLGKALARISHQLFATGFERAESSECDLTAGPWRGKRGCG
jgi:alkylhydroperoxidase/carboxymuconolactone decarboxylase family protein YurZ